MREPDDDKTRTHVTLTSGTMVSHYRIIDKIGAGGMGEVYLAEDTNLNRQIAIKVLPDMFGSDQERLARFEREAKLLASLNHPNLATIHGLENVQGKRLLVMELVEGETLAERIAKGPLPLEEALDVFCQIAAGMEAAHEKGIIHRDLKPANIKITPEGKVKILDFGLAKALQIESAVTDLAKSPTITENMTRAGVILGTAAYMSPEQAKGKPVDKRTDIWAFGCILFECLTGRRAFEGETVSETLAAVLRGEPRWDQLPAETPANIKSLLHRCLQKDASRRLRDIGDASLDASDSMVLSSNIPEKRGRSWGAPIPWVVTALMIVVSAYLWYAGQGKQPVSQNPIFSYIVPPENSVACFCDGMALSPDGRMLAFVSLSSKGERLVWVRLFSRPDAAPLPGTNGATYPFWSPDSKHLAFYAGGWLKRVPAEGGQVQTLCRASSGKYGGCWGTAGTILFCDVSINMSKVAEDGGDPVAIPHGDVMGFPCFLPDGKHFLYTGVNPHGLSIFYSSLEDSETAKEISGTSGVQRGVWVTPDRLVLYRMSDRSLTTQRLNLSEYATVGSRNVLADQVPTPNDWPVFSISQTGTAAFVANPSEAHNDFPSRLMWVNRKGNFLAYLGEVGGYWYARISPDGRRVIYNPDDDVWVFDVASGLSRRITNEMASGSSAYQPLWSPEGDRIWVHSNAKIKEFLLSGESSTEVFQDDRLVFGYNFTDWSRDGKNILCDHFESGENSGDIVYFESTTRQFKPFLATRSYEQSGYFSPDGHWVAYVSDETGSEEVYVRSFPDGAQVKRVSYAGGMHPRWRADGKELFYLAPGWTVMSAAVTNQPELEICKPVALFQTIMADIVQGYISPYDVSPDGQRFLVISPQTKPVPLTLVQNWQALIVRK